MTRYLVRTASVMLALTLAAPAFAGEPGDQAAAFSLFQEAKKLAAEGDYTQACPKFAEAQRLFPTTGTLLNLGNCYEQIGKLASAWGAFKQAEISARNAREPERRDEAKKRAEALESKLSKLTISVAGNPDGGIEVRRDGALVGEGQWGTAVPVDPGEHVVEVTAPKRQKWSTKVNVGAGGVSVAVSIPELPLEKVEEQKAEGFVWNAPRIAGVSVGSAGVVGLALGAAFGARAIAKNNESKNECSPVDPRLCNDTGVALRNEAKTAATVSTTAIIAGGVLAAGGVVLFVTAPSTKPKEAARFSWAPVVGRGEVGMVVGGRW